MQPLMHSGRLCPPRLFCDFRIALAIVLGAAHLAVAETTVSVSAPAAVEATAPPVFPDEARVAELIAALGNSRYVARREAEQALLEIGMRAFDQIDAATAAADPEIAASCRYLLSELTIRWTRRDDPPQVKRLLFGYADTEEGSRRMVVAQLSQLENQQGLGALCRICRYDTSSMVARQAAIALLHVQEYKIGLDAGAAERLREEIGASVRPAAHWVRLLALQLESPQQAVGPWRDAIERAESDSQAATVEEGWGSQSSALVMNLIRLHLQLGDEAQFLAAVDRLVAAPEMRVEPVCEVLVQWILESHSPTFVDGLLTKYDTELSASRGGLYLLARCRADEGDVEQANELAEKAFQFEAPNPTESSADERLLLGRKLSAEGQIEWARREYRAVTEQAAVGSEPHAKACFWLADSLHDWQLDAEAAEALQGLTSALKSNAAARNAFNNLIQNGQFSQVPDFDRLQSYEHYYRACHQLAEGDTEGHWKSLQQALKHDESNADIIIAMYRASEGDADQRQGVLRTIDRRCRALEQQIDAQPDFYQPYNEWAWLVSNTEGDYDKAVRYSLRSLELNPGSAGLFDTLGRCYFAAGDVENAIKSQQQAVELAPHQRVIQRQLRQFEEALEQGDAT